MKSKGTEQRGVGWKDLELESESWVEVSGKCEGDKKVRKDWMWISESEDEISCGMERRPPSIFFLQKSIFLSMPFSLSLSISR